MGKNGALGIFHIYHRLSEDRCAIMVRMDRAGRQQARRSGATATVLTALGRDGWGVVGVDTDSDETRSSTEYVLKRALS